MVAPVTATKLILRRTFNAPRAEVFKAWTDPKAIARWFAPGEDYENAIAEIDLRVGGTYRIGMKPKTREALHVATGVYREIRPPEKLVFTWSWEGERPAIDTLVTLTFRPSGNATELTLTHEFFPDGETRDQHNAGWNGCLAGLEKLFSPLNQ